MPRYIHRTLCGFNTAGQQDIRAAAGLTEQGNMTLMADYF